VGSLGNLNTLAALSAGLGLGAPGGLDLVGQLLGQQRPQGLNPSLMPQPQQQGAAPGQGPLAQLPGSNDLQSQLAALLQQSLLPALQMPMPAMGGPTGAGPTPLPDLVMALLQQTAQPPQQQMGPALSPAGGSVPMPDQQQPKAPGATDPAAAAAAAASSILGPSLQALLSGAGQAGAAPTTIAALLNSLQQSQQGCGNRG
jgi:hypothetical protein